MTNPERDYSDEPVQSTDLMRVYLDQIGKTDLLTAEQEVELAQRIEAGLYAKQRLSEELEPQMILDLEQLAREGDEAKKHMVQANLLLVVSIARKHRGKGLEQLDLIQEGNLGLIRAVEKFDYTQGFKFSTYAPWWINQAINNGLADRGRTIRLPIKLNDQVKKVDAVQWRLRQELDREPTYEELAAEADIPVGKIADLLAYGKIPASLDIQVGEEEDESLGNLIVDSEEDNPTEKAGMAYSVHEGIGEVIGTLKEREAQIIRMRFGIDDGVEKPNLVIGNKLGLSADRVSKLANLAIGKLKIGTHAEQLRLYAEE